MTKKERQQAQIKRHGQQLAAIFGSSLEPAHLARKVHRIELKAHRLAENYCNGVIDGATFDAKTASILDSLDKILHFRAQSIPVFVNGDPRGYALKIDDDWMRSHNVDIHRDWGGYGILAPEFEG